MFLAMLTLPVFAAFSVGLLGRYLGVKGSNFIVLLSLFSSTLLSLTLSYEVIFKGSSVSLRFGPWFDTGLLYVDWGFVLDPLGAWLSSTVLVISFLVHVFATSYMSTDPSPQRFMCLLVAFTASMVLLVTGDSLGILFLGWELIGITSFLLIGYWWDRSAACNAATQALIVNRIGDWSFTLALMLLLITTGVLDLNYLLILMNSLASDMNPLNLGENIQPFDLFLMHWAGIFLVVAAFGKSAQFLLHTWLPNSMEGPTPVSALLHAATLVAGGTYLLLRCSAIIGASSTALMLAAIIGTISAIFAASTALFQSDAKRIIAYSTMSQFGYLTASIGLGQASSTLFHLSSHSGFKALLFITAGGVIHATSDQQDIRKLGGLISALPFTYCGMLIGSLSLIATPYLSGFFSKDLILELAIAQATIPGSWMWLLGSIVAGITASYSIKLLAFVYLGSPSGPRKTYENTEEQSLGIIVPIVILSLLAIIFGYFAKESIVGVGLSVGGCSPTEMGVSYKPLYLIEADFGLGLLVKNFPFIATITGTLLGIVFFIMPSVRKNLVIGNKNSKESKIYFISSLDNTKQTSNFGTLSEVSEIKLDYNSSILIHAFTNKWWLDALYSRIFSWPGLILGLIGSKIIDRGIIEVIGPTGLTLFFVPQNVNKRWSLAHLSNNIPFSYDSIYSRDEVINKLEANHTLDLQEKATLIPLESINKNLKLNWVGNNLPDYSSYIVLFTFLMSFGILILTLISLNIKGENSILLLLILLILTIVSVSSLNIKRIIGK